MDAGVKEIQAGMKAVFGVATAKINTFIRNGKKFAIVQLKDSKAIDLATQLGII
jgi:ribosomal protein L23